MLKDIPVVRAQLKKCVRCGQCRVVCPIFREIRAESAAPRGHVWLVQMLKDGEIAPSEKILTRLNRCLLCESCYVNCPSKIPIPQFVQETRQILNKSHGSAFKRFVFKNVWTRPNWLNVTSKMLWAYQATGLRQLAHKLGVTKMLPGDLPKAEQILNKIPAKSARKTLKRVNPARGNKTMTVGYYLGCATDILYPDVALDAVEVLTRNGIEVIIPDTVKCCGMPQSANGQKATAEELAKTNVEAFKDVKVDYIVCDCASCSGMLKSHIYHDYPEFQKKVIDLTAFLTKVAIIKIDFSDLKPITVTYHDPCHLVKGQKISAEPRKLLKMMPHVKFQEMKEADQCCGGAGTFGLSNYDLSMKILDRKAENITETNADIVATCCPTCTMQISHGINRKNAKAQVKHPVQILAEAYRMQEARSRSVRF